MTKESSNIPEWALKYDASDFVGQGKTAASVTGDVVGFSYNAQTASLDILDIVRGFFPYANKKALPGGYVEVDKDKDATEAAVRELFEETSLGIPTYVETLDLYDKNGRDPRQFAGTFDESGAWVKRGARVFSKAHLCLFQRELFSEGLAPQQGEDSLSVHWDDAYAFIPWEDLRSPEGRSCARKALEMLRKWASSLPGDMQRAANAKINYAFGFDLNDWNEERTAERYALLFEAKLVVEAHRNQWGEVDSSAKTDELFGNELAFDHRQMVVDALSRLRSKIKYVPALLHAFLPEKFTLSELQALCEAVGGKRLHKSNFRQTVARSKSYSIVKGLGEQPTERHKRGPRPELYSFLDDVNYLRLDPSIRMPWLSVSK